jgi:heptosyltransferase-2
VLPNSFKSALLPWFADIPQRTGWRGEMRFGLLNDLRVLDKEKYPLMVQRFIALAYAPGATLPPLAEITTILRPRLNVGVASATTIATEVTPTSSANACEKFSIDKNTRWIGLCPGAEFGPAKRWPSTHYAALAELLIAAGFSIALFGSAKDQIVTNEIIQLVATEKREKIIDLAGKTQLAEAVDLLAAMELVVSNDSGLMHIAAAVDIPVVALYGSTSPGFTPPLAKAVEIIQNNIACSPCFQRECPKSEGDHLRCLNELLPQTVFNAVQKLLPDIIEVHA